MYLFQLKMKSRKDMLMKHWMKINWRMSKQQIFPMTSKRDGTCSKATWCTQIQVYKSQLISFILNLTWVFVYFGFFSAMADAFIESLLGSSSLGRCLFPLTPVTLPSSPVWMIPSALWLLLPADFLLLGCKGLGDRDHASIFWMLDLQKWPDSWVL